jgi:endonuclease/exonuclease/phosphatase family metal-dependent hydrolase
MNRAAVKGFKKSTGSFFEEPRGALWVRADVHGIPVNVMTTHLSVWPVERMNQAEQLCADWLKNYRSPEPLVLCGDLNALPDSPVYRCLNRHLRDAQRALRPSIRSRGTWFGHYPFARIDHIFVNAAVRVTEIRVPRTRLELMASDHIPLIAELELKSGEGIGASKKA